MLQRGDGPEHWFEPTREVVAGDAEITEHREASESVELDLAGEAEAVEDDACDVAGAAVAVDAGPGGAGIGVRRERGRVP